MKLPRRNFLHLAAAAAALPAVSRSARAQAYPTRPVRLIVGWPPGGGADTVSRIVGQWLSERLGQQVIISVPTKTVAELIAHAKANPGKVTMASFGTGS